MTSTNNNQKTSIKKRRSSQGMKKPKMSDSLQTVVAVQM